MKKFNLPIDKQIFLCYNTEKLGDFMENAVILDFMGVIADFDCLKLILDTPLKDKLSSGRLILRLTRENDLKSIFKRYKSGEIDQAELTKLISGNDKKLNALIPSILKRFPEYVTPNKNVIQKIRELKDSGAKVIILSNTIPIDLIKKQNFSIVIKFGNYDERKIKKNHC